MNKQIGRIALTFWLLLMLVPAMALAAGTKYVVVGAPELCGSNWDVDNKDNVMTQQPDGTYVKVFSNVSPNDGIQIKVVEIREDFTQIWHGVGGENFTFNVTKACDVTVTFDPKTAEIKVSGSGVVVPTGLDVAYITAVGNGGGNWLYGEQWTPPGFCKPDDGGVARGVRDHLFGRRLTCRLLGEVRCQRRLDTLLGRRLCRLGRGDDGCVWRQLY